MERSACRCRVQLLIQYHAESAMSRIASFWDLYWDIFDTGIRHGLQILFLSTHGIRPSPTSGQQYNCVRLSVSGQL